MRWPWRRQRYEEIDPLDFKRRAEAVQIRMEGVTDRGKAAAHRGDWDAVEAAQAEAELLLANLRELQLEQIEAERAGYRRPVEPS